MQIGSPFDALHEALASAVHTDLPDIEYWQRDWVAYRKLPKEEKTKFSASDGSGPGQWVKRRPMSDETRVIMFPETWGSTALGYGGIGGAAMTPAYTIIVSYGNVSCVYFGCGRLAYTVDHRKQSPEGAKAFIEDKQKHHMAHVGEENRYD